MIICPKKELIIASRATVGMKGFFKFKTIDKFSGKSRIDTDWMPNTILNAGREVMATRSDWMDNCQVGTNGTFPAALIDRQNETSLGAHHAGTSTIVNEITGQAGSAPYYGYKQRTFIRSLQKQIWS